MKSRFLVVSLFLGMVPMTVGQVIVDETFDAYASNADFESAWRSDSGDGNSPTPGGFAVLTPAAFTLPTPYDAEPASGQALLFDNGAAVYEWDGAPFELLPSSTEVVRYSADIFDDGGTCDDSDPNVAVLCQSNPSGRRFTVALRNDTVDRDPSPVSTILGLNFLEMGHYNADTYDPTNPDNLDPATRVDDRPSTGYGYRAVLLGAVGGDLVMSPNWQYFQLDPSLDTDGDGLVSPIDIGPGWHRYTTTVTETGVRFELDLFRDGSIDASEEYTIGLAVDPDSGDPAPFTSLRVGGPSGISRNALAMVDNIKLEVVEETTDIDGDFNDDSVYDCLDIDALVGEIVAGSNGADFDLTGDGFVNVDDRDAWLAEAGAANLASGNAYLLGDANLDGSVDVADFNIWNSNKFSATGAWCAADFNADGSTDVGDFNIWNGNKFNSADAAVVPEPSSLGAMILAGLWLFRRPHSR